jgi:hypothetical protein
MSHMESSQHEIWASQIRDLYEQVCSATGQGAVVRERVLDDLADVTGPDALERLGSTAELLDVLALAASGEPQDGDWHGRLWQELADAAADLYDDVGGADRFDDGCGNVQDHIDYLVAGLQVPDHLTGAFRQAVELRSPADALVYVVGDGEHLSLPALASMCHALHTTTCDLATRTPPGPTLPGSESWTPHTPPPTEPDEVTIPALRHFLLALRWRAEQITVAADDPTTHQQWDVVLDAATTLLHVLDDDLVVGHLRDPLESIHWLQRAAIIPPALLDTWTQVAGEHGPTSAYNQVFAP